MTDGMSGDGTGVLRDQEDVVRRLGYEAGLDREEAMIYLKILEEGSVPATAEPGITGKLVSGGLAILSGDGKRIIPVHPRLGIANYYRTWRENVVREINQRRMRVDSLILELIPLYEAATEKKKEQEGG